MPSMQLMYFQDIWSIHISNIIVEKSGIRKVCGNLTNSIFYVPITHIKKEIKSPQKSYTVENAIEIVLLDVTLQSGHTKQISIMCMVSKTVGHRNWQTISDYVLCVIVIIEEHW